MNFEYRIGDMRVAGPPPGKLAAALTIIATHLHDEFDRAGHTKPDKSKESCILASATVREFLFRAGFRDAEMRPCVFVIIAEKHGEFLHSLGIGNPKGPDPKITGRWDGHAVATASGWLIDTTLYQAKRAQWPALPGMVAAPLIPPGDGGELFGLPIVSGLVGKDPQNDADVTLAWLDQPTNKSWKTAPDYQRKRDRSAIADRLLQHWKEAIA